MKFIDKFNNNKHRDKFCHNTAVWVLILLTVTCIWAAGPPVVSSEPIVLKSEVLLIKPVEFYIANVVDERPHKTAVAYLFPVQANTSQVSKAEYVDLKGGAQAAIQGYLQKSLPNNTKLRPVVIQIKELMVTENSPIKGRVEGQVFAHFVFGLQHDSEVIPLVAHKGGIKYNRPVSQSNVVEPAIRQVINESIRYFDNWMNQESNRNELLAKAIQVHFMDHTFDAKDDTVFYTSKRPLNWGDFLASPTKDSKYAAAVFPGFAYEGQNEVKDGVIHLNLKMKVFVVKSASWARTAARDAYTLNHEQRHFDIVKLVAERFKHKIHPDSLTVADYNSIMQYKYIESYREMNRLQEQYDRETIHGKDDSAQLRWNQKIEEELRLLKVK